jgi:hypothetical protein
MPQVIFVLLLVLLNASVCVANSSELKVNVVIENRQERIALYKKQVVAIKQKINQAELELIRLSSIESPDVAFDVKNDIIGVKYDINKWLLKVKNLQATIVDLEYVNQLDIERLNDLKTIRTTPNTKVSNAQTIRSLSNEELQFIRAQQRRLIEQSYSLDPASAALKLAKAKALEPMTSTVLGEAPELVSVPAFSGAVKRSLGLMRHMGGNQYQLETMLRSGKQDFIVGDFMFTETVALDYEGVRSVILLDLQDVKKPSFQYFAK